ncbi:resolvase [Pseudomonas syringae pv. actinidiae ICMP 18804]|uniref:Resolvase n=2 Tax=Pseudomonas syringae pv. actinidiae TaxID=103796 RepID=A0A656JSW3_PSESF|nr:resolvase [Pseudomonas syringae pv. actinidiae ICMP 19098]EPN04362.1 resolvase [Pseudomonas syringae pv. actinidiae ICMP 18804]EPN19406.1 resolvase [Pseudomonas syringae pv. actinidiae ICMP 19100]EPN27321.1 resolvase [Pseudomonas syringae pv. actinidiae ICMP 19099]EPN35292.1 resolvase [Pseudomonas syringae pv. actinidiae ICMP 18883]EPN43464.1 resolvase [Pseudomonas syringae pv. actinidiae ICMP 19095]EPN50494.1 resolvase [Pseudomonas syringae pv. actinidiae ICMP 19094]EPN50665.1 resolvase 
MQDTKGDEFTGRMLGAINSMLVEMMSAIARKDYEQLRERQAQRIEKANIRASRSTPICTSV